MYTSGESTAADVITESDQGLQSPSVELATTRTNFLPGTKVAVYDKPVKDKKRPRPVLIGKGVITSRVCDGKRYLKDQLTATANLTVSRKEVRFHQLISKDVSIPFINNYYSHGATFAETFEPLEYCFECMIAESHLCVILPENEDDTITEGENESESTTTGVAATTDLLLIGTDEEIKRKAVLWRDEVLLLPRTDERLGLNPNDIEYYCDNEDDDA